MSFLNSARQIRASIQVASVKDIVSKVVGHAKYWGRRPQDMIIGITSDIDKRMQEHGRSLSGSVLVIEAPTYEVAREAEATLVHGLNFDGRSGGETTGRKLYAFPK
ncbi:hypothetical protein ABWI00_04050 [Algihabitans albus]|uniref:hypothetical protein n=1 Tax=Algihabitans albus TaxID=2164067 RepID=UPI0035CECC17